MPLYTEPRTPEEAMRIRIAKAALCEAGCPELAEHVQVNAGGHLASVWWKHIQPTPLRAWLSIKAFALAMRAVPVPPSDPPFPYDWKDHLAETFLTQYPQWQRGYRDAQAAQGT